MNFLKWYSAIIISLATAVVFVDFVVNEDGTAFLAFLFNLPVAFYLWKLITQK